MSAGKRIVLCTPAWSYATLSGRPSGGLFHRIRRDVSGQGDLPTLGLHYLATTLEGHGHNVTVLEGYRIPPEKLLRLLVDHKPDVVGIYLVTALWKSARDLIGQLRKSLRPGARIAVGGPHANRKGSDLLLECSEIDRVFRGPDEKGFLDWIEGSEKPIASSSANCSEPSWDHPAGWANRLAARIPWQDYVPNVMFLGELPFATSVTSLGCSRECAFCGLADSSGGGGQSRKVSEILEEITYLGKVVGIRDIHFMDDVSVFVRPGKESEHLLTKLAALDLPVNWSCYLDRFDLEEEWLHLMRRAGCKRILMLVETGVQRIMDYVKGRPVPLRDVEAVADRINRAGIEAVARFQFGFPGETVEDGMESIRFALKLPLTLASFIPAMLYPDSRMANDLQRKGLVTQDETRWSFYGRPYTPDAMTVDEQEKLVRTGLLRFYGRPAVVGKNVHRSMSFNGLKRNLAIMRRVLVDGVG